MLQFRVKHGLAGRRIIRDREVLVPNEPLATDLFEKLGVPGRARYERRFCLSS